MSQAQGHPPRPAPGAMAGKAAEGVPASDAFLGIGDMDSITFFAQACALLGSSVSILLRTLALSLPLLLRSAWIALRTCRMHPRRVPAEAKPGGTPPLDARGHVLSKGEESPLLAQERSPGSPGATSDGPGAGLGGTQGIGDAGAGGAHLSPPEPTNPQAPHSMSQNAAPCSIPSGVELYRGRVLHSRTRPVGHRFSYPVRMALLDLDQPPRWFRETSSHCHVAADRARELAGTDGEVLLLTHPVSAGYEQNPISVYYCYAKAAPAPLAGAAGTEAGSKAPVAPVAPLAASAGTEAGSASEEEPLEEHPRLPASARLAVCLAEVTNTPWGDRVLFSFSPGEDVLAKPMHVSPFMDMESDWRISASAPGQSLRVTFRVRHPDLGAFFTADLSLTCCTAQHLWPEEEPQGPSPGPDPSPGPGADQSPGPGVGLGAGASRRQRLVQERNALAAQRFLWLMPQLVAFWIYWHALVLWWQGCPLVTHPKYSQAQDYRLGPLARDRSRGAPSCCWINSRRVGRSALAAGDGTAGEDALAASDGAASVAKGAGGAGKSADTLGKSAGTVATAARAASAASAASTAKGAGRAGKSAGSAASSGKVGKGTRLCIWNDSTEWPWGKE